MYIKKLYNKNYILLLAIYLFAGLYFLKYYMYQINPDAIPYIIIAQKYIKGDFWQAVNGHWSPLISWLLIPLVAAGIYPLLAFKILNLIIGFFTLTGFILLTHRFDFKESVRISVISASMFLILWWAYIWACPDLLSVTILIYYFIFIFDKNYGEKKYVGLLCGFMGALAYLAKAYHFPFYLLHFCLCNMAYYIYSKNKKSVIKTFLSGLLIFFALSFTWSGIISKKYNTLTISTAGTYNYYVFLAGCWHPMHTQGFLPPFPDQDFSPWEDPSFFKFNLPGNASVKLIQAKLISQNLKTCIETYKSFSPLSRFIIINFIFLSILYFKEVISNKNAVILFLTFLIYPSGYILLYLEDRYIWITGLLLILTGGYILNFIFRDTKPHRICKITVMLIFVLSFWWYPVRDLYNNRNKGKCFYTWSQIVKERYNLTGNIAGDSGYWWQTMYIAYHLKGKHYGEPWNKNVSFQYLKSGFNKYDIDYYLQWDKTNFKIIKELSSEYEEIKDNDLPFYIYKLKK